VKIRNYNFRADVLGESGDFARGLFVPTCFGGGSSSSSSDNSQSTISSDSKVGASDNAQVATRGGAVTNQTGSINISTPSTVSTGDAFGRQRANSGARGSSSQAGGGSSGITVTSVEAGGTNNSGNVRFGQKSTNTINITDAGATKAALDAISSIATQTTATVAKQISAQDAQNKAATDSLATSASGGLKNYLGLVIVALVAFFAFKNWKGKSNV
jgi:hypothetical protein